MIEMKSSSRNWERIEITLDLNTLNEKPSIGVFNYKEGREGHGHIRSSIDEAVKDVRKLLERKWKKAKGDYKKYKEELRRNESAGIEM